MAGKIVADTLEHSTAGSLTTDYVVNGSAKAWVNFNGTGTIASRDSFNVSGLVDDGVGLYTATFSNSMADANYAFLFSGISQSNIGSSSVLSGSLKSRCRDGANSNSDFSIVTYSVNGDLA